MQIIGEGPNLKLFSKDGQIQCVEEVLPFKRVHGIRPGKSLCKYIQKLEIWRSHTPCACSSPAMLASKRLPCIALVGVASFYRMIVQRRARASQLRKRSAHLKVNTCSFSEL